MLNFTEEECILYSICDYNKNMDRQKVIKALLKIEIIFLITLFSLDLFKVSMDIYRYAAYLNMFLTVLKLQPRYDKNANDKIVINDIIVFNKSIEIILVTCLTLSNVNIM